MFNFVSPLYGENQILFWIRVVLAEKEIANR